MRRKISADVDGGLSGVSRCADTGARTPIGVSGILTGNIGQYYLITNNIDKVLNSKELGSIQ